MTINNSAAAGLAVRGNTGRTNLLGVTANNAALNGVNVLGNAGETNFSNLTVADSGLHGVFIQANTGPVNFNNTLVERAGADAIRVIEEHDGPIAFNNTTLLNPTDSGIVLSQTEGGISFENTLIANAGAHGVLLDDTTGNYRFGQTTITNTQDVAFLIDDGESNVEFTGRITQTTGAEALAIRNIDGGQYSLTPGAAGGPTIVASNLDPGVFAVDLDADGSLAQINLVGVNVDANGVGGGLRLTNLGVNGLANFENLTITNAATGVAVLNNDGFVNFQQLQSTAVGAGSIAFLANDNTALVNVGGANNRLVAVEGRAALIEQTNGFLSFDRITVTDGDGDAVVLRDFDGGFFVQQRFTVDGNTAGTGWLVENATGQFVAGRLDFDDVLDGVHFTNVAGSIILGGGTIGGTGAAGTGLNIGDVGGALSLEMFNTRINGYATGVELLVNPGGTLTLGGVNNTFGTNTQNADVTNNGTINGVINFNGGITVP